MVGQGNPLDLSMRRLIKHNSSVLEKSARETYDAVRMGLPLGFTFDRVRRLCKRFHEESGSDWEFAYLEGLNTRKQNAGRPFALTKNDRDYLESLIRNRCTHSLEDLRNELFLVLENETANIPATSTIFNNLVRMGYTLKVT